MKKKSLFLLLLPFLMCGCNLCFSRIEELGSNFALVESDSEYIEILYSSVGNKDCYMGGNSYFVVPSKVLDYNYDDRWIIVKSKDEKKQTCYWIIDKMFNPEKDGIDKQLLEQTIGPLDFVHFELELKKHSIMLQLKNAIKD